MSYRLQGISGEQNLSRTSRDQPSADQLGLAATHDDMVTFIPFIRARVDQKRSNSDAVTEDISLELVNMVIC